MAEGTDDVTVKMEINEELSSELTRAPSIKKKNSRIVPSRYKQAAANQNKSNTPTRSKATPTRLKGVATPTNSTIDHSDFLAPPPEKRKPFSTPGKLEISAPNFDDVSAIHDNNEMVTSTTQPHPPKPPLIKKALTGGGTNFRMRGVGGAKAKNKPIRAKENEFQLTAVELEVLFSKYIRAELLWATAEQSMEKQSSKFLAEIWGLSRLNAQLMDEKLQLEAKVVQFAEQQRSRRIIEQEIEFFNPTQVAKLELLSDQLDGIAKQLETCQHHLVLKNCEKTSEENMEQLLESSCSILQGIVGETGPILEKIRPLTAQLEQIGFDHIQSDRDCQELGEQLKALDLLTIRSMSMDVQRLQC